MIKLGSKVRDSITGFTGIATSRHEYLYGCMQIGITPVELREGKPVETWHFDDQRVELLEAGAPIVSPESTATSGGPQNVPAPRAVPKR